MKETVDALETEARKPQNSGWPRLAKDFDRTTEGERSLDLIYKEIKLADVRKDAAIRWSKIKDMVVKSNVQTVQTEVVDDGFDIDIWGY